MVVEDITPQEAGSKHKRKQKQLQSDESDENTAKVKLSEFKAMNGIKTAVMGKRIYCMYTCLDNMLPGDDTTLYQHVFDHVAGIHANALRLIGAQPDLRRRFLAFVSCFELLSKLLM